MKLNKDNLFELFIFLLVVTISVIALFSNTLLVKIIYAKKTHSNTFQYIASQAIGDALSGLIALAYWYPCSAQILEYNLGIATCEILWILLNGTFAASKLLCMFIAIDRYLLVCHYSRNIRLKSQIFVPISWILAMIISITNSFNYIWPKFFTDTNIIGCRYRVLRTLFEHSYIRKVFVYFGAISSATIILIPVLLYIKVVYTLRGEKFKEKVTPSVAKKMYQLTNMLIAIASVNSILILPDIIRIYIAIKGKPQVCTALTRTSKRALVGHALVTFTTLMNPFIVAWFDCEFRDEFSIYIRRAKRRETFPDDVTPGDTTRIPVVALDSKLDEGFEDASSFM